MFGLGMMEIGLIIALAVMLFPAKELPKLVRSIARIYGQIRRTAEDFRTAVLEDEDLREPIDEIKGAYNDARWEVRDAERKARQQLAKAQMELRMATARRLQAEKEAKAKAEAAGEGGEAAEPSGPQPFDRTGASTAGPVRIAAAADDDDDDDDDDTDDDVIGPVGGPVAAPDPRVIAARTQRAYTPATDSSVSSADADAGADEPSASGDEPREGVA